MGCQDRFDSKDTDKDGKVTKEEFKEAPHGKGYPEMFKTTDVKGQGHINSIYPFLYPFISSQSVETTKEQCQKRAGLNCFSL